MRFVWRVCSEMEDVEAEEHFFYETLYIITTVQTQTQMSVHSFRGVRLNLFNPFQIFFSSMQSEFLFLC